MVDGVMIDSHAVVESNAIGEGTRIWTFSIILKGAKIGKNCNIGGHCYIENDVIIGDDVVIKNGVSLWDKIRIGDKVFVGPNAAFVNDIYPRTKAVNPDFLLKETIIEEGASIGANATILCGIKIGKYAMIGAGAVVTKDIPEFALARGVPARIVGKVDIYGHPIRIKL
jgi:acetyltransferase-like isoleucine patch superfamily enzyme